MLRKFECTLSAVAILVAFAPATLRGQCDPQQLAQLVASSPGPADWFGYSVAISGDVAVVGAWMDDNAGGTDAGSAYLFARNGNFWVPSGVITAFDAAAGDNFGQSTALLGDRLIIGAPSDDHAGGSNAGSAYVYRLDFDPLDMTYTPVFEAKLAGADTAAGDGFGVGLAMGDDRAIIGAILHDHSGKTDAGAAFIFIRSGATWSQQAKLTLPDPENQDYFGLSVALSSDVALVSAPRREVDGFNDAGAVYAYRRNGSSWQLKNQMIACDAFQFSEFGTSVALSGSTALIGAFNHQPTGRGAAYVFVNCGTSWNQEARLIASDGATSDHFGISVAIEGDAALVGAYGNDHAGGTNAGAAYMFIRSAGSWYQQAKLTASNAAGGDEFGVSVAFSNETAVIGAWRDDQPGAGDAGSAYLFQLPDRCDSDGDGILDIVDACPNNAPGLARDSTGRPLRDCNQDCLVDATDIQCIVDEMLSQ